MKLKILMAMVAFTWVGIPDLFALSFGGPVFHFNIYLRK